MTKDEAVKAFREKTPVMLIYRDGCSERTDIEYERISAVILRNAANGKEIVQVELKSKTANSVTVTRPEYVYFKDADAPPSPSESRGIIRHKYGEYKNVLLSDDELDRLKKKFPDTYDSWIQKLSAYIATKGNKYKNHMIVIETWARREAEEKEQRNAVRPSRFNNYKDTNKPDYSKFGEEVLENMLREAK